MEIDTEETVRQIAALARAGRLDEAAIRLGQTQSRDRLDPVLAALGGAIEFHRSQFARAIPYLQTAHKARPDDLIIRANLAESLYRADQSEAALKLCDATSAQQDNTLRLARIGAHLAQETENYALAIKLYRLVVTKEPSDWSAWNNLGNCLGPAGDGAGAIDALTRARKLEPNSPPIRVNLGNALVDAGRYDEAVAVLTEATTDFPDDSNPWVALAEIYRTAGREEEAFDAIAKAAARAPGNAEIQSDHGQEAARRNLYAIAEAAFEKALSLKPDLGPSYVGLASVYERMNREDELAPLRVRAVAQRVADEPIAYIDALQHKRAGDLIAAFDALERTGEVVQLGRKLHLKGTMLDRMGRHDEAFSTFVEMNEHWKSEPTQPLERARQYRAAIAQASDLLSENWLESWTPFETSAMRASPIFLVGFPRSGTTLLDTMLMADPAVVVLEEEPFIGEIERDLGGIDTLPRLTHEVLSDARDTYFKRVAELVDLGRETIIVDKHPMHLNKVAMIRRLFPDARFILALRHPCDVLLSCFLTNFRVNHAMANFLDLSDAADLYDLTFTHWEKARSLMNLPVSTVVYERLIQDPIAELRPVFEELGLVWPAAGIDHQRSARERGIVSTASYAQVTEPLYTRAAGRWEKYRTHLEPILPVLQPWIERYGYS